MAADLRVLGAVRTDDDVAPLLEELHARGYERDDIKLVANHPLPRLYRQEALTYQQSDVDPTDDNLIDPENQDGIFINFESLDDLKIDYRAGEKEEKPSNESDDGNGFIQRLRSSFSYGHYLTDDEAMLIRDYQPDVTAGHVVILLDDKHVPPGKRYYLD